MFLLVEDYIRGAVAVAPPKDNYPFTLSSGEVGKAGNPYYFHTDGLLKLCAATSAAHVIVVENNSKAGGTVRGYWVTPGMVFKAKLDGTPDAGFVVGLKAAKVKVTGGAVVGIDATATSGGKWTVLRIDTTNGVVFVTPSESLFH